jgi:hypothetical protein
MTQAIFETMAADDATAVDEAQVDAAISRAKIVQREAADPKPENGLHGVADPAIFASDGGPSIAKRMARARPPPHKPFRTGKPSWSCPNPRHTFVGN